MLDNAPSHTSKVSRAALVERAGWLHPIRSARYTAPEPQGAGVALPQARRVLVPHGHPAGGSADGILAAGLRLGGAYSDVADGAAQAPDVRPPDRARGAKNSRPRKLYGR